MAKFHTSQARQPVADPEPGSVRRRIGGCPLRVEFGDSARLHRRFLAQASFWIPVQPWSGSCLRWRDARVRWVRPCRRQPVRSGQVRARGSINSGATVAPASPAGKVGVTACQGHFEGGSGSCDTWTCHRTCHRRFPRVRRGGVDGSHRSPPSSPVTVDLSQKSPHRWRALII